MIDYNCVPIAAIINNNAELISARNVWEMATTKAAARKATATGVTQFCANMDHGELHIFQVCGYNMDRGMYADLLDKEGRIINETVITI